MKLFQYIETDTTNNRLRLNTKPKTSHRKRLTNEYGETIPEVVGPWVRHAVNPTDRELVNAQSVAVRDVYHKLPQTVLQDFHQYTSEHDTALRNSGHDFISWNSRREEWARDALGIKPGVSHQGTIGHIRKELEELAREKPGSGRAKEEIVDLIFLVFQLATIHGITFAELVSSLEAKLEINIARKWCLNDPSRPIEHERTESFHEGDTAEPVG